MTIFNLLGEGYSKYTPDIEKNNSEDIVAIPNWFEIGIAKYSMVLKKSTRRVLRLRNTLRVDFLMPLSILQC